MLMQRLSLPLVQLLILSIIIGSIILFLPVFQWLAGKIALEYSYLHLAALIGLSSLTLYHWHRASINPFLMPVFCHPGLFIWIPATGLYLYNEAYIGVHILSGSLFVVYLFGLAGHFLDRSIWRSMLLPVLLIILILPFEQHLDVFLGFPLRLLSAQWAGSLLQLTGLPTLTTESILMIDNRAAIVDLDCSGINSLWIGTMFYLLLTWVERYRINFPWFLNGLLFLALLVAANVARITILVTLELVLQLPQLAAGLHQFLGLLGFVLASVVGWILLHCFGTPLSELTATVTAAHEINDDVTVPPKNVSSSIFSAAIILSIISGCIILNQHLEKPINNQVRADSHYPVQLSPQYRPYREEMSLMEQDFFTHNQAQVQKTGFNLSALDSPVNGSMILVWSKNWRTHHIPENCYLGQGYSISEKGVWVLNEQSAIRFLSLNRQNILGKKDEKSTPQTGIYWFQSASGSTPDYSHRVLAGISDPADEWVMVSILWDRLITVKEVASFVNDLKILISHEVNNYENKN